MKKLIFCSLLILSAFVTAFSQTQYEIVQTPLCWDSAGHQKDIVRVSLYTVSNQNSKFLGYFSANKGYRITATVTNTTAGFCSLLDSTSTASAAAIDTFDFELIGMCSRGVDDFIKIVGRNHAGAAVWIADVDYNLVSGTFPLQTPGNCFRFAPPNGGASTYPVVLATYSYKEEINPGTPGYTFTYTIPDQAKDLLIYNTTESYVEMSFGFGTGDQKFIIPAKSVFQFSNPKTSILSIQGISGDLNFNVAQEAGTGYNGNKNSIIINLKDY